MNHIWSPGIKWGAGYSHRCSLCNGYYYSNNNLAPSQTDVGSGGCGVPAIGDVIDTGPTGSDYFTVVAVDYVLQTFSVHKGIVFPFGSFSPCTFPRQIGDVTTSVSVAVSTSDFPHTCPNCSAPAYVGFSSIDCSRKCK